MDLPTRSKAGLVRTPMESRELPDTLVEGLDDLDEATLRAVRTYVEQRLDEIRPPLEELIRSETDGEIVEIRDDGEYTLVGKRPSPGGITRGAPDRSCSIG